MTDGEKKGPLKLIKGTVDLLILRALEREGNHGYAISKWIRETSGGELGLEDAALYQALHRLEAKEWIVSHWGLSSTNRRAKFYRLTPLGERRLASEASDYRRYAAAVFRVLDAT